MTTLTRDQQSRSISQGKKKRSEKKFKQVLVSPFEDFWPLSDADKTENLYKVMAKTLVSERKKPKLPWKKLCRLPKLERKEKVKEVLEKNPISNELLQQRRCICFGINELTRALEKDRIISCIICADTKPISMVKHIVVLAATKLIPVLAVPNLKQITQEIIGFSCTVIGLKTTSLTNNHFVELHETISQCSSSFKIPPHLKFLQHTNTEESSRVKNSSNSFEVPITKDVYCYRSDTSYRVFDPEPALLDAHENMKMEGSFIAIPKYDDDDEDVNVVDPNDVIVYKKCKIERRPPRRTKKN